MIVYLAVEFNWKRLGGVFSSRTGAEDWCNQIEEEEPNLMWEVFPFKIDEPISVNEAVSDWRER